MLVSLPFITSVNEDNSTDGNTLGEITGQGAFPLSSQFGWHGGMHFQAPGNPDSPESVRAMADGTVVFARDSAEIPDHAEDPDVLEANPLLYYKGWTSNGVVIIRHDTEIGDDVKVTFYSIYQHLHKRATRKKKVRTTDSHGHAHNTVQDVPLDCGDKVYRKESIGQAGVIYGQINRIHVECVADAANVAALMGRNQGQFTQTRKTCVWGASHITVPAGTLCYSKDPREETLKYTVRLFSTSTPTSNETLASVAAQFCTTPEKITQLNADAIARLRQHDPHLTNWFAAICGSYQNMMGLPAPNDPARTLIVPAIWGDGPVPADVSPQLWATWQVASSGRTAAPIIVSISEDSGRFTLTARDLTGKVQGSTTEDSYGLYDRAMAEYPGCASAGYELLRLGRVLGPDALAASDQYRGHVPHMRKVRINGKDVFIDLNVPGVKVCSDADFPDWQGWTFIDDDTDGNSRCDSGKLIELILSQMPQQAAPTATPQSADAVARQRLQQAVLGTHSEAVRERLKRCVVKMPTEWARDDFDQRWGWVMNNPEDLPANVLLAMCMSPDAYARFKRHHAALAFWEDARAAGLQLDKVHYHVHPRVFVETFRKCRWLSEGELTQMLPMHTLRKTGVNTFVHEIVSLNQFRLDTIRANRTELNKALRKYGISSSPLRMAAFFGNAAQETQWFQKLRENDTARYYWPWDGRGFLQLTNPENYIKYWRFRGRVISDDFKNQMRDATKAAKISQSNLGMQDVHYPGLTEQMRKWREDVSDNKIDAADSACAYWAWSGTATFADQTPSFVRHMLTAGGQPRNYYSSECFGQVAATVNFGSPTTNPASISLVYGILARYQSYVNALFVLDDYRLFPNTQGLGEVPDDFERRTL